MIFVFNRNLASPLYTGTSGWFIAVLVFGKLNKKDRLHRRSLNILFRFLSTQSQTPASSHH